MSQQVLKKRLRMVILAVVLVFSAGIAFGERGLFKLVTLNRQHKKLVTSMDRLRLEQNSLRDQILQLEKGGIHLERFARERLGLVAADEIVYEFRAPGEGK